MSRPYKKNYSFKKPSNFNEKCRVGIKYYPTLTLRIHTNSGNTAKFDKVKKFSKNTLKNMELFWSLRVLYMRGEIYEKNISAKINLLRKITDYRGIK